MTKIINLQPDKAGVDLSGDAQLLGGHPVVTAHNARVVADGGTVGDSSALLTIIRGLEGLGLSSELLYVADAGGMIERVDGVLRYIRTAYDITPRENDLNGSATATIQPRLVGGIAPNSKVAASNQMTESRKFTHNSVTVSGTYTLVKAINNTGKLVVSYDEVTTGTLTELTWTGTLRFYMIYAGVIDSGTRAALTANILSIYPEIESVTIGSQIWSSRNFEATTTPMGNVIANVTANGAVEKIINSGYAGTTDWVDSNADGLADYWTISGGTPSIITGSGFIGNAQKLTGVQGNYLTSFNASVTAGRWVKVTGKYRSDGILRLSNLFTTTQLPANTGSPAEFSYIMKSVSAYIRYEIQTGGSYIEVDECKVQELGWANATEIYDAVYSATAGTAAQKEYAALKEAAMWCYYNNDAANGAIYGKLYNWYAAKLLDLDMQTAGFGWRVPTSAQFTTLATYLGGASVAGGKMKMTGLDYWNTPNTGATNESGFTALGSGDMIATGFRNVKAVIIFSCSDSSAARAFLINNLSSLTIDTGSNALNGNSIRLIKST